MEKNPYVEFTYTTERNYEKVRLQCLEIANKNNWALQQEERKENGEALRFRKKLTEYPGHCEWLVDYNKGEQTFTVRITWFDGKTP